MEQLAGGVDNAGAVIRIEDTVRRPGGPAAVQVRLFLQHLQAVGFTSAPRFRGLDEQGREILDYLDGAVAIPPFPDWVAGEDLLLSVALLQAELHRAAAGFRLPCGMRWPCRELPQGDLVCHTDVCLENVVVRQGRAAAFIDFDLATPVDPLFDIAVAARIGFRCGILLTLVMLAPVRIWLAGSTMSADGYADMNRRSKSWVLDHAGALVGSTAGG